MEALSTERSALMGCLDEVLDQLDRCHEIYLAGSERIRRSLAFSLFRCIYIDEEGVVGSDLASPYAELLELVGIDLASEVGPGRNREPVSHNRRGDLERPIGHLRFDNPNRSLRCAKAGSSNNDLLIGEGRFELPASTSRTWRANQTALLPGGVARRLYNGETTLPNVDPLPFCRAGVQPS